jgi:hypothetical protein
LCLTTVAAFGRVVDFPRQYAGEKVRRMAAKLCAFLTEMCSDIERAVLGYAKTAIAVLGFEVVPDNPFPVTHD